MKKFTDLLDNYLLALGTFNQAHALHAHDPLRYAQDYRDTAAELKRAKEEMNTFFDGIQTSLADLTTP